MVSRPRNNDDDDDDDDDAKSRALGGAVGELDSLTVIHEIPMGDGSGPGCMYWVRSN